MTSVEPDDVDAALAAARAAAAQVVVRPRTIGAFGPPSPVAPSQEEPASPPLEAYSDLSWQPPTGTVAAIIAEAEAEAADAEAAEEAAAAVTVEEPEAPDPDIWTVEPVAEAVAVADRTDRTEAVDAIDAIEAEPEAPARAVPADDAPATPPPVVAGNSRLLRANLLVASGTAVSRLTGLVRTFLVLYMLGRGLGDAFFNANNTPNMIYELILGGILTASLVPLFTDDLERGDGQEATSAIISFALVALLVVTLLGLIGGPLIILLFSTGSAHGTKDAYIHAGVPLALLFAPQIFFYGLMAVWSAVLNARQRFMAAAWAPVLNNVVAVATLLYVGHLLGGSPTLQDALDDPKVLWVLGLGTTAGIAVMALSLYPALRRSGFRLKFKVKLHHPAVQRAVRLSAWTFGYVVANQIAAIIIQILAKPGSGGSGRYQVSFQWFQLPHALLAVSIMVTFEPLLGRADSRGDRKAFNDQLLLGFRLIGLLIIPAAAGYIALPKGLDSMPFHASGALETALALTGIIAAFAVGLPGFSTYLFALRGFYAKKNTKIPFVINCGENLINIVLAVIFVRIWGVVGLALSFAAAYSISAVIAVSVLNRHSAGFDWRGLIQTWLKLLLAAGVMGGFVYGVVSLMAPATAPMLGVTVLVGVLVGCVTYFASIYALQVPGISELMTRLPGLRRFA
ncbi:murein biosynthesis integral membrane protein MurJ [Aquihabitans sp. McL0605]|uniref:murein biosynthesis integral membrane protein MurJ n=1 Tax=Aquihabitans sp. McL0605 TaxID=3415671 RepID=UPI003CF6028A